MAVIGGAALLGRIHATCLVLLAGDSGGVTLPAVDGGAALPVGDGALLAGAGSGRPPLVVDGGSMALLARDGGATLPSVHYNDSKNDSTYNACLGSRKFNV
ncbi:hypothetical protein E2562_012869 [Oryza meyeriana var. granulata]|uniref:Xylanase inhibitor N-terminal domain-containing protein n=1 Tax=Oryza meyeriana var. granulata TaxID=110450 RepID=A0A6G1CPP6_9ORYZ|nr:hypothetical protein E2562_012869 [Oryza meyeriana var. granulata]